MTHRRPLRFLGIGSLRLSDLIRATAANHSIWMTEGAIGLRWRCLPDKRRAMGLLRPARKRRGRHSLSPHAERGGGRDSGLDPMQRLPPPKAVERGIGCWALTPTRPRDLGARMMARGFEWGWKTTLDGAEPFDALPSDVSLPDGLRVSL